MTKSFLLRIHPEDTVEDVAEMMVLGLNHLGIACYTSEQDGVKFYRTSSGLVLNKDEVVQLGEVFDAAANSDSLDQISEQVNKLKAMLSSRLQIVWESPT